MSLKIISGIDEFELSSKGETLKLNVWPSESVELTPRDAARLAAILDAWAEKGYLPEKDEVWE